MKKGTSILITIFLIATNSLCLVGKKERTLVDCWIKENNLNPYGDPVHTMYAGGTPLFDESTGKYLDQYEYLYQRYPDKPWDTPVSRIALNALKDAKQKAEKFLYIYVQKANLDDIAKTVAAMRQYKSWFQSSNPTALPEQLSPQGHALLTSLKTIAQEHFIFQGEPSSTPNRLTCFGDYYFTNMQELFHNLFVKKAFFITKQDIESSLQTTSLEELENLKYYISFYRSWYQAVTPAPKNLEDTLSPQAKKSVNLIKSTAEKYFMQEPIQRMPGASRLSLDGTKYYDKVINWLAMKIEHKRRKTAGSTYVPSRKEEIC
jgi:hypothetical protein